MGILDKIYEKKIDDKFIAFAKFTAKIYFDYYLLHIIEEAYDDDEIDPVISKLVKETKYDGLFIPSELVSLGYDDEDPAFNDKYLERLISYVMTCRNFIWPLRLNVLEYFGDEICLSEREQQDFSLHYDSYRIKNIENEQVRLAYISYNEMEQVFFKKNAFWRCTCSDNLLRDVINNKTISKLFFKSDTFYMQALCMYNCMKYDDLNPIDITTMHFCKHKFPTFETDENENYGIGSNGLYEFELCNNPVRTLNRCEYEEDDE